MLVVTELVASGVPCIRAHTLSSRKGVLAGKQDQKWRRSSHSALYRFFNSFWTLCGTSSATANTRFMIYSHCAKAKTTAKIFFDVWNFLWSHSLVLGSLSRSPGVNGSYRRSVQTCHGEDDYSDYRLVTACKRSLGQGNIFRSVSRILFKRGGGVVSQHALQVVSQHVLQVSGGGGLQAHTQGEAEGSGLAGLQVHVQGEAGLCIPACTEADPPPRDSYCRGRYASYWIAFLM